MIILGIIDNFVYCGNSIVVIFFLNPNLLDTYTEVVRDEICYKVIQGIGESEWVRGKMKQDWPGGHVVEAGYYTFLSTFFFKFYVIKKDV